MPRLNQKEIRTLMSDMSYNGKKYDDVCEKISELMEKRDEFSSRVCGIKSELRAFVDHHGSINVETSDGFVTIEAHEEWGDEIKIIPLKIHVKNK